LPWGAPNRDASVIGRPRMAPLPPEAMPVPRAIVPIQATVAVLWPLAIGVSSPRGEFTVSRFAQEDTGVATASARHSF